MEMTCLSLWCHLLRSILSGTRTQQARTHVLTYVNTHKCTYHVRSKPALFNFELCSLKHMQIIREGCLYHTENRLRRCYKNKFLSAIAVYPKLQ
jgi:hypothetical protein